MLRQVLILEFLVVLWQKAGVDADALQMAPHRHEIEKGEEDGVQNLSIHWFRFHLGIPCEYSKIIDLRVPNHIEHCHTIHMYQQYRHQEQRHYPGR